MISVGQVTQKETKTYQLNKTTGVWSCVLSSGTLHKERYAPTDLRAGKGKSVEVIRGEEVVTYILSYQIVSPVYSEEALELCHRAAIK